MAYNATKALAKAIESSQASPPSNDEALNEIRKKINQQFMSEGFRVNGALGEIHFTKEGYVDKGNFVCLSRVGANPDFLGCQSSSAYKIK